MAQAKPNADPRLRCPKDGTIMERVKAGRVDLDRCAACGAIWFDASELAKVLADKSRIAKLDTGGDPRAPQGYAPGGRLCPRDKAALVEIPHTTQTHIQVDLCRVCRGVLLDAGELKDMSEFSLRERLAGFFR
jgi:Zn-finger nucleic acid-binding protein